ncbi:hypothetical protein [Streptomyces sp. NPDC018031]|uniref:hypothetical protein n=1 Tax=Streptomyces sp. NPDC018031 TaxID=3365033 RepID=UPI003795375E
MSARPRLLPWSGSGGQPAYLVTDGGADSRLWRLADDMEAVQLRMGAEMIQHARAVAGDAKADSRQLRYVVHRLAEALADALRVADSRGMRLAAPDDGAAAVPGDAGPDGHGAEAAPGA